MHLKLKVLIVEDSDVVTLRIREVLNSIDEVLFVGAASNSIEAHTLIRIMSPDVVLLDISIPGKNGIYLLKDIKQNYSQTKVIMLTNYSGTDYRDYCYILGADYFFDKSTEFEKIPEALKSIFSEKNGPCQSST